MERRRQAYALMLAVAAHLVPGCGEDPAEIEGERMGWPEEVAEEGAGRFLIDGEELDLSYQTIGGHRTFEGDIVLDDEVEIPVDDAEASVATEALYAVSARSRLWPRGVVPYTIAGSVTTPSRVRAALRTWAATGIRFVPRTTERAYVTFLEERGNGVCRAQVGYDGGRQYVYLRDTSRYTPCNLGVVVHETGHVLGLWHEHTRPDRGSHVDILWSHVPTAHRDAFAIMGSEARRIGAYDIGSTMHYRSYTLTRDGHASITRSDGRLLLHDWATISSGDVAAIRALYFDGTPVPRPAPAPSDAGPRDAGARDAGAGDAGPRDAGASIAVVTDAGAPDAGPIAPPDASIGTPPLPTGEEEEIVLGEPWEDFVGDDLDPDRSLRGGCSASTGTRASGAPLALALALMLARIAWRGRRPTDVAMRLRLTTKDETCTPSLARRTEGLRPAILPARLRRARRRDAERRARSRVPSGPSGATPRVGAAGRGTGG